MAEKNSVKGNNAGKTFGTGGVDATGAVNKDDPGSANINVAGSSTSRGTHNSNAKGSDIAKQDMSGLTARIKQLEEEVKVLALTIDKVEDEKLEIENQMKKALADYHNLERAMDKRMELRSVQLRKQIAQDLLILMDDIQYGLNATAELNMTEDVKAWLQGLMDTTSKMAAVLGNLGIELMNLKAGDQFDSGMHEAIAVVDKGKENTIVEVVQHGYVMGDMVIRPARVVVSKKLAK